MAAKPIVQETIKYLGNIRQRNGFLNAFVRVSPEQAVTAQAIAASQRFETGTSISPLNGSTFAIKDNICTKDMVTSCSSLMLADFIPEYDSAVVAKLRDAGAIIIGKTNMDEFGMGSHSTTGLHGPVKNPNSSKLSVYSAGGSSGGSAAAVAGNLCFGALGSDTGGSVRLPASYCGVVGFKPSYGLLSRQGVIAYANSLDTVGIFARDVRSAQLVFDCLNEYDPVDPSSLDGHSRRKIEDHVTFPKPAANQSRRWNIGVPVDYNVVEISPQVKKAWISTLAILRDLGHNVKPVNMPSTRHAVSSYYIIALAEASSNLAKYDGIQFGPHILAISRPASGISPSLQSVVAAREKGFGKEVRRRILLGSYSLTSEAMENYFIHAQRVRRRIKEEFDGIFSSPNPLGSTQGSSLDPGASVDFLISPVSISSAPNFEEVTKVDALGVDGYINDVFTVPASMAGLPAISVPVHGAGGLPIGLQVTAQYGDEKSLFEVATLIENLLEIDTGST
ncbi:Glu-AdT subunit A [Orbilia oligospora]|uniref:Glutamyl-tRNA(Gln) amidotransferase subunit A, mitochondrial n=1 Tax=Orbilia oligospora TaxID=2813651 RepID=A0A7C8UBY7_ORBOL|nr:Glu-AdT subunit A [Orbilia oligospora]